MAQKNISVTEEAYNALSDLKGEYMSFTDVILLLVKQQKEINNIKVNNVKLGALKASKQKGGIN